jgi:membrane protease YdiL (CAAX protease family)
MNGLLRTGLGRTSVAAVLGLGAHCLDGAFGNRRYLATRSRPRSIAGAAFAFAGPVAAIATRIRGRSVALSPPPSPLGKAMLGGYILAGVLAEELAWRKVLTYRLPRTPLVAVTVVSTAGFVLAHLRRDGRGNASVHTANTIGWTASALTSGSIRWSVLGHWTYNCVALSLRSQPPAETGGRP